MRMDYNLKASLLDRLMDSQPAVSYEPVQARLFDLNRIKASLTRDLENLLNTRQTVMGFQSEGREALNTFYAYGLKDFSSLNPRAVSVKQSICMEIENAVSIFEPRLQHILVEADPVSPHEFGLKFRITALLVIEPIREAVTFDTYFDTARSEYIIRS